MTWLNMGEMIRVNATKYPDKLALKDARRHLSFREYDTRTNKLANGLLKSGLKKGDRLAIFSNNSLEYMEVYGAAAKAGIVVVPLNFRLHPDDLYYIVKNSGSKMMLVEDKYLEGTSAYWSEVEEKGMDSIDHFVIGESSPQGPRTFEDLVALGEDSYPEVRTDPEETWVILYTSGTTGRPKGAIRSHRSYIAFFLVNEAEFSFTPMDYGLILMPLSHVNSTFYSFVFTYIGAPVYVHREFNFDPEETLRIIHEEQITFTSMIPTHYNLILGLPEEIKDRYDLSSMTSLLTSSAPATKLMKLDVMGLFTNAKLFEAYGSTEAGLVTILRPEDQMNKLGSIGKECIGLDCIKILLENGEPVPDGEIGELFSRGPQMFDGYHGLPEKTRDSFQGEFFSAGDMARKDRDGFYYLVDRKANMIITGGEHVYPSEVEKIINTHPSVVESAVVGLKDHKWGEAVTAIAVLKQGKVPSDEMAQDIRDFCDGKMARFKKPKRVIFLESQEIPRTGSGKVMHRLLRDRFNSQGEDQ